jgi:hypothetical protein
VKAIIHRIFIVLWIVTVSTIIFNVFDRGLFDDVTLIIGGMLIAPTWALQFIFTGLLNPLGLNR